MNSTTPTTARKGLIRLALSPSASEALTATGERAFVIVGKASHPEDSRRWMIHLAPVDFPTACDACEVLLGTKRAIRKKANVTSTRPRARGGDKSEATSTPAKA